MDDNLTVAFIGAGAMAREHVKVYAALPGARLRGITARTPARAEKLAAEHAIPTVADTVAGLWEATRADLVVIAVKELGVLETVRAAARHPWAIFLEKPAGYTPQIAREVAQLAEATGRPAYVGLNRRFNTSTLAASAALGADAGQRFVAVQDQQSLAGSRAIGHPEDVVRHMMYANSIHTIDLIAHLCRGAVEEVIRDAPWAADETFVHGASIRFASGDRARYDAVWQGPGPWSCAVTTPSQRLEMRPLESLTLQVAGSRIANPVELDQTDGDFKPGFLRQAEAVLAGVRGRPTAAPTLSEGLATMDLIEAIYGPV